MFVNETVKFLIQELNANNFEGYVVGGCVRDSFLNIIPKDYDITTNATPEQVMKVFNKYKVIPTGLKHGTVSVMIYGETYEITTYRKETTYTDNRHPDKVYFVDTIEKDLSRRDFTMNAIAYNPITDEYVDPFHGISDIYNKVIKCVGNADDRFNEDALRMLRAIRFSAQKEFVIEESVIQSIIKNAYLITNVSSERIKMELDSMLLSNNPIQAFQYMYDTKILYYIIPELYNSKKVTQNNINHIYNVFEHTINSLKHSPKDLIVRYSLLFHDLGKCVTKTTDKEGVDHFYKHSLSSRTIAHNIMRRLCFDNNTRNIIEVLVENHDVIIESKNSMKRLMNRIGENLIEYLYYIRLCDIDAQNSNLYDKKFVNATNMLKYYKEIIEEKNIFKVSDLKINGNDLLNMGYESGKLFGIILNDLLEKVINEELVNEFEDLKNYVVNIYNRS
jgi:tRNA nucleotidyltransferase (CCA-adding enzyme)